MTMLHRSSVVFVAKAIATSVLALSGLAGCALEMPFEGPGYVLGEGLVGEPRDSYIAATTDLILGDDPGAQAAFDTHVAAMKEAIIDQPGFVGMSLGTVIFGNSQRTLTVWESEEAMLAWVVSDTHIAAMEAFAADGMADPASKVAQWTLTADEMPPTWAQAREHIEAEGREVY
jgi:heme-degrading monooxygenase HmoA